MITYLFCLIVNPAIVFTQIFTLGLFLSCLGVFSLLSAITFTSNNRLSRFLSLLIVNC